MALVQLDGQAMRYIHDALAHPYPFAEALRRLSWEQGSLWAFVPTSDEDRWPNRAAFLDFIDRYLHTGGRRVLVMSHPFPSRHTYARLLQGSRLGRAWAAWCVCGNALCFYTSETADVDQIIHVFDDAQGPTTFGVLARDVTLPWHEGLQQETLDDLVAHADYAVLEMDIYDNSAELIWSRTGALEA